MGWVFLISHCFDLHCCVPLQPLKTLVIIVGPLGQSRIMPHLNVLHLITSANEHSHRFQVLGHEPLGLKMSKLSNITSLLHRSAHSALAILPVAVPTVAFCRMLSPMDSHCWFLYSATCLFLRGSACIYNPFILCFLTSYHTSFFSTVFLAILWLSFWKLSSLRLGTWSVLLPLRHLHLAHVWHIGAQVNAWVNQFLNFIQWAGPKWNLCNLNYELNSNWSTESMIATLRYFTESANWVYNLSGKI